MSNGAGILAFLTGDHWTTEAMNYDDQQDRLSRLSTQWSQVFAAHADANEASQSSRSKLVLRYTRPVYRYLLAMVRDPDVAEDLSQEFITRFLEGRFSKADPGRGRFRDYVKRSLANLVNDYHRGRRGTQQLPADVPLEAASGTASHDEFESAWRDELMQQAWEVMKQQNGAYYSLLRMRLDAPDLTSGQLAEAYSIERGKQVTAENVRKTLERARVKFAELLVLQVVDSLESNDQEEVRGELLALDLLKYCRSAFERWCR